MTVIVAMAVVVPVTVSVAMMVMMAVAMTMAVPVGADPHHMVVVADLRGANITFKADDLLAIFAQLAVHIVVAGVDLGQALGKAFKNHRVIFKVTGLDEFDIAELGCDFVGVGIDTVDQDTRKQEIGENHNAFVAQFHSFAQTRIHARMGNTGIADFGTAKSHAFLKHAGNFINV